MQEVGKTAIDYNEFQEPHDLLVVFLFQRVMIHHWAWKLLHYAPH